MIRIACFWVPHLMAQVERQRLGESARPLLVCQGEIILDACARAAAQGVQVKDSLQQALTRCPQACVVEAERTRYQLVWQETLDQLARHSPVVEDARQGVAYLDAWGMGSLYGDEASWCQAVAQEVRDASALETRLGVAGSRFATWVAARSSQVPPAHQLVQGSNRGYLAPLSIRWLPLSKKVRHRLSILGLPTLGQFAALSATAVCEQFGSENLRFHRWARGEDDGPLQGRRRRVLEASLDFEVPENRRNPLLVAMEQAVREALDEASAQPLTVQRLTLRARLFAGDLWENAVWVGQALGPQALRESLERLIEGLGGEGLGVAQIHLKMIGLEPTVGRQLDLFAHTEERLRLEKTFSQLSRKHPPGCVTQVRVANPAASLVADQYTLETYHP